MTTTLETIQTLTFGTECEFTHLSRQKAAHAIQSVVGGSIRYEGGAYDTWAVDAPDGRVWKAVSDSSLQLRHLTFAIVHAPYRRVTGRRPQSRRVAAENAGRLGGADRLDRHELSGESWGRITGVRKHTRRSKTMKWFHASGQGKKGADYNARFSIN